MLDKNPEPKLQQLVQQLEQKGYRRLMNVVNVTINEWPQVQQKSLGRKVVIAGRYLTLLEDEMALSPAILVTGLMDRIMTLTAELDALKAQQTNAKDAPKPAPIADDIHVNMPPLAAN